MTTTSGDSGRGLPPETAARFAAMFPTVLRPSRRRNAGFAALCLLFVAGGLWMMQTQGTDRGMSNFWWGVATVVFFGLGTVVFGITLLPGAAYLKLEATGFTVCSLFRKRFTPWQAVEHFGVTQIVLRKYVGIAFTPAGKQEIAMSRVNTRLIGFDDMLPDTYGRSAEELTALLNDALALAPAGPALQPG
ncbi:MAG: hypothetical protein JO305_07895 [Alphaproteobacteria bacterium]|nr:hypothetical protein [Alphaproteobacteria bacterium]